MSNRQLSDEEIKDRVTYHAPSPEGIERHERLARNIEETIRVVDETLFPGREKSLAITKLEEAKMWASAGIARNPETR